MTENVIECKGCSAPIDVTTAINGVVECTHCHRKQTVARSTNADAKHFLKIGEHELDCCKFDEAYAAYKKASEYDNHESEAYWGMALAEHKVQYIIDNVNNRLQPICHEISDKVFSNNKNYQAALLCASPEQQELYKLRAKEIDEVRKEFYELKNSGLDYDCFICVKVSDDKDGRTSDYKTADEMYFYLRDKGYTPFFSEREIKSRTGADYEALILYALYTSECMIVVCSNEEYLKTPWVHNEYTRFMSMINDEQKERDSITIAFSGRPIERLSGKNGKIQGINMDEFGAPERVVSFVETHTPEAQTRRKNADQLKQQEEERIKAQLEELKAQQEAARLELERKLAAVQSGGMQTFQPTGGATVQSLLTRARQFLNAGNYDSAKDYSNRVLDMEPDNVEAWYMVALAEFGIDDTNGCNSAVEKYVRSNDVARVLNSTLFKTSKNNAAGYSKFAELEKALHARYDVLYNAERRATEQLLNEQKQADYSKAALLGLIIENDRVVGYTGRNISIEIPEGVTTICQGAFKSCKNAERITFPSTLVNIERNAFDFYKEFKSINIKNLRAWCGMDINRSGLRLVEAELFCDGSKIVNLVIPDGVERIGSGTFAWCSTLQNVTFPNSVTCIGNGAFVGCKQLRRLVLPNSVKTIESSAFSHCENLLEIILPNGLETIEYAAFSTCTNLNNVVIPNSVTKIDEKAFEICLELKNISIPSRFKDQIKKILGRMMIFTLKINYT